MKDAILSSGSRWRPEPLLWGIGSRPLRPGCTCESIGSISTACGWETGENLAKSRPVHLIIIRILFSCEREEMDRGGGAGEDRCGRRTVTGGG